MASSKGKRPKENSPDTERRPKKSKFLDDSSDDDDDLDLRDSVSKMSKDQRTDKGLRSPIFSSMPTSHQKPAELFRKDLISAMKLADTEQLIQDDYVFISDPWRQEWERGVQVPVNPDIIKVSKGETRALAEKPKITGDFKLSRKLLHAAQDETFKQGMHDLTAMQQLAEQVIRYDLDDIDVCWLKRTNEEREEMGHILIDEWVMERAIEELEYECHGAMQKTIKTQQGLGIEYDADVICDVCRSPDSEDTNEMVFCDGCDICVHQACYGIQKIPQGSWLCRICAIGIKPLCILCPRLGGAMKPTKSGTKWSHVSCALWIPEVSIGCVERMEPITKISQIPASRWSLICCLCKERTGACIQCSVKTCKTAFHVTCAFDNNLDMRTVLDETDEEDGVKLKAYCPRHSKKKDRNDSESDSPTKSPSKSPSKSSPPHSPRKELTSEEQANLRADRLKRLEAEFYTLINVKSIASSLGFERSAVDMIYNYWKLKRKSNFDKPLLTPKHAEQELLEKQQEDSLVARMKMFVRLRQDLERVRNLCYMVSRREKIKRQYSRLREGVFCGQVAVLTDESINLTSRECSRIGNLYSQDTPPKDLSLLLGVTSPSPDDPFYRQRLSGPSKGGKGKLASTSKLDRTELHYKEMSAVLGGKDPRFVNNNQDRQSRVSLVSGKDSCPVTSEDSNAEVNKHRRTGGKVDDKYSNDLLDARTVSRRGKLKEEDLLPLSQEDDISVADTSDSLSFNVSNNNSIVEKAARFSRSRYLLGKSLYSSSTPQESRESSPLSVLSSRSSDVDYTPVSRPDKHLPTVATQAKRSKLSLGKSRAKASRPRAKSTNQLPVVESDVVVPVTGECDSSDLVDVERLDECPPDDLSDVIDDVTGNIELPPVILPEIKISVCNKKDTPINGKYRPKQTSVTVKDINGLKDDEDELSDLESDALKKVSRRLDQSYKKAGVSEKSFVDKDDMHNTELDKRCEMLNCNVIIEEDLRHQAEERIKRDLGITDVSQLVIKDKIRDKIQHQFLNSRRAKRYMNGIHEKSQRRLDTYYKLVERNNKRNATSLLSRLQPSRTSVQKTQIINKVLNDISPRTNSVMKRSLDSSDLKIGKKLNTFIPINDSEAVILDEKLCETRSRNGGSNASSRSSTPDPLTARNRVSEHRLSTSVVTRSRESTPDPSLHFPNGDMRDIDDLPGRLTRKQGQENIEDVLNSEAQAKFFPIR